MRIRALFCSWQGCGFLSRAPVFLAFPPPLLLFALNLPYRLAAAANALSGMVNSDLLLLLHGHARMLLAS
jgi:hypothetical protein